MGDILVVTINKRVTTDELMTFREDIIRQAKDGVVVLPNYCDTVVVPNIALITKDTLNKLKGE